MLENTKLFAILLRTYLSFIHLNSNAAVCVTGGDDNAVPLNSSEAKADLQLCAYHKLLRCKKNSFSAVRSFTNISSYTENLLLSVLVKLL